MGLKMIPFPFLSLISSTRVENWYDRVFTVSSVDKCKVETLE